MVELLLSLDLECFTKFALNDTKEERDLIFTGKLFHIILAR